MAVTPPAMTRLVVLTVDIQSVRREAQALLILARNNGDAEAVKELIDVPPEIELLLRTYAKFNPSHGAEIERMLAFRKRVLKEFERIADK